MKLLAAAALTLAVACNRSTPPPPNPAYVEIYTLTEKPDARHVTRVTDSAGQIWYRANKTEVDLASFLYTEAKIRQIKNTTRLDLPVLPGVLTDVYRWSEERLRKEVGIFLDGKLIVHERMVAPINARVIFPVDPADSQKVLKRVRSGGQTQPAE